MSVRGTWIAAMAAVGLVACGRGSTSPRVAGSTGDRPGDLGDTPGGGGPLPATGCRNVTIRLLGVAQGDVSAAHLVLGGVSAALAATGDALQLEAVPSGATLDLSTDMNAFALGALRLADLTGPVAVTVSFTGGDGTRPAASGALATCAAPLTFDFAPGQVNATRCEAIVKLDVGRSLLATGGALSLLPQFAVAF